MLANHVVDSREKKKFFENPSVDEVNKLAENEGLEEKQIER
jgi:hypothetical protein